MELGIADQVFIVGLAKRLEEVIVPGDPLPLFLDRNSSSLRVLMQIRDEAHRFGITHHRKLRSKAQTVSQLRAIPGIGPRTEEKLIKQFKSYKRIKEASLEELTAAVGPKLASLIHSTE